MKKILFIIGTILLIPSIVYCQQQQISLSTWYPSPFGRYQTLSSNHIRINPIANPADYPPEPCQPGSMFVDTSGVLNYCQVATWNTFGGGQWTPDTDKLYPNAWANPDLKIGIDTDDPKFKLSLENDGGILAEGTFGAGTSIGTPGDGTRFMWYPQKAAIRAGNVTGDRWDDGNIGDVSSAFGNDVLASGDYSFAAGDSNMATGQRSVAMGYSNEASGQASVAMGWGNVASGYKSFAVGYGVIASNEQAIAMGRNVNATGIQSVAMGVDTTASDAQSFAMGTNTTASGAQSFAMGLDSEASGPQSVAIGNDASALASSSTVSGGYDNCVHNASGTIGGGAYNEINGGGVSGTIAGGYDK